MRRVFRGAVTAVAALAFVFQVSAQTIAVKSAVVRAQDDAFVVDA